MREGRATRIVLAVLVLLSITLVIMDLRGGTSGPTGALRSAGAAVLAPIERVGGAIFGPVIGVSQSLSELGNKDQQIADLQSENARLQAELDLVANDKARVAELDALLELTSTNGYVTVPAQVIAVGPAQGFAWTVTIDAGSRDGVDVDMSVVSGSGLVGRTISVTPTTATILLVVDATSSVGGRLAGTSQIGIVSGSGRQDALQMQLLDPLAIVEIGDVVVSFGSEGDRPYAPGIPIGTVQEMRGTEGQLTRSAVVQPYVDVSRLDIVGVIVRVEQRAPREPIVPTPAATSSGDDTVGEDTAGDDTAGDDTVTVDDEAAVQP